MSERQSAPAPGDPTATLLLVEDEEQVRRLFSMVLESAGYRVLQAADAATAIAIAASHDGPIDLLITDVVIPDMDGRAAARAIMEWRPGCRVLFISGYPPESEEFGGDIRIAAFLQKPFVPRALVQRVRELLNDPT